MTDASLSLKAVARGLEALNAAAAELNIAAILAPSRTTLATDADVVAEVVSADAAAVLATLRRHG